MAENTDRLFAPAAAETIRYRFCRRWREDSVGNFCHLAEQGAGHVHHPDVHQGFVGVVLRLHG